MKINVIEFNKKADLLKDAFLQRMSFEEMERSFSSELCTEGKYTAFISVCDKHTRARVLRCTDNTLASAWHGVCDKAARYINSNDISAEWVKADIIRKSERVKLSDVVKIASSSFNEFFRRGISFDEELDTAVIEAEINGNRLITYKKKTIELSQLNKYLPQSCGVKLEALPEEVIVFDCLSFFCDDENNIHELYNEGNDCGRRIVPEFDKQTALDVITTSSEYLAMQLDMQGKFQYGVYPIYHKFLPGYNILRHASSIWSLMCAYRITKDSFTLRQVELALGYLVKHTFYKYRKPRSEENTAYVAELEKKEVKLGGNAVAILVMTEYMDVTGSDKYKKLCIELGNGILELFDSNTGEFFHVLNIPDLSCKEKTRTVYYDGETVFALARLYSLTKDQRWLDAAKIAVDRFIHDDYTKHRDHWVAYALNEITKYAPEEKYFNFGLKNAQVNLQRIYNQQTTYHTYLELLCVTFELYDRVVTGGYEPSYLPQFDVDYFIKTLFHRADYMLNGYCYPEYVMYLRYPERILGAFFVRHDGYRIRIDDIQHFCGAYYSLYRNYEKLDELRRKANQALNAE